MSPLVSGTNKVHLVDSRTGERLTELLHDQMTHSAAVIGETELLLVQIGQNLKPEISITSVESGVQYRFACKEHLSLSSLYDRDIFFGKIVLIPGKNQALISGVSDRYDIKGFLIFADWSKGIEKGKLLKIVKETDEAPYDVVATKNLIYVATGRRSSIAIFSLSKGKYMRGLEAPGIDIFKPMRVVASGSRIVAASYNQLFWWNDGIFAKKEDVSGSHDTINGLADLPNGDIVCALTYSNQLLLKSSLEGPFTPIALPQPLEHPCWVVADPHMDGRIYVTGHANGSITAVDMYG